MSSSSGDITATWADESFLKCASVPTWSMCAWVISSTRISSGLKPSLRIEASIREAEVGMAPSIRTWPAFVATR